MDDGLIAFWRARLDETEGADWHVIDCSGMPHGDDGPCCEAQEWLLRDAAADRAILGLFEEFRAEFDRQRHDPSGDPVGGGIYSGTQLLHQVVKLRASAHSDHADYQAEWKP